MKTIFTRKELAEFLMIPESTVQAHFESGRLKSINLGIDTLEERFHYDDIEDFFQTLRKSNQPGFGEETFADKPRVSLPGIWRVNLKPSAERGVDPRQFCLTENIAAVGWCSIKPGENNVSWEKYRESAEKKWPDGVWWPVREFRDIPTGSVIWTRAGYREETRFYAGQVIGEWHYRRDEAAYKADCSNTRPVRWHKVGGYSDVPKTIAKAFTPKTLQQITTEEAVTFTEVLAAKLMKNKIWANTIQQ